mmetsp:Transcript_19928/g.61876  ORF Transcript_19928/g.61876 Transcript_19928/m.61876 type:complete len:283 (-) Transcript_19928:2056-2904(-)
MRSNKPSSRRVGCGTAAAAASVASKNRTRRQLRACGAIGFVTGPREELCAASHAEFTRASSARRWARSAEAAAAPALRAARARNCCCRACAAATCACRTNGTSAAPAAVAYPARCDAAARVRDRSIKTRSRADIPGGATFDVDDDARRNVGGDGRGTSSSLIATAALRGSGSGGNSPSASVSARTGRSSAAAEETLELRRDVQSCANVPAGSAPAFADASDRPGVDTRLPPNAAASSGVMVRMLAVEPVRPLPATGDSAAKAPKGDGNTTPPASGVNTRAPS